MATAPNASARTQELRRELITAGACPFSIAASALAKVERLERQLNQLSSSCLCRVDGIN